MAFVITFGVNFLKSVRARKLKVGEKKVNKKQLWCTLTDI